ncbi:GIY-YIG nuclease family protein [Candidatus Gottesmanbacteria bacterium]|nr:GIY-YIG nuclease family protein [Candidatus Gottesmanbacteria bacterium]
MYYTYIIEGINSHKKYIGYTSNWEKRLIYHNGGLNKSTKPYRPYKIIFLREFASKKEAIVFENKLKSYKGGDALKQLIKSQGAGVVNRSSL